MERYLFETMTAKQMQWFNYLWGQMSTGL